MNKEEWLASLKPGDPCFVETHYQGLRVGKVKKITPKGFIAVETVGVLYTFTRDGTARSGKFYRDYLHPQTPELIDSYNRTRCISFLSNFKYDSLDTKTLMDLRSKIKAVLNALEPKGKP